MIALIAIAFLLLSSYTLGVCIYSKQIPDSLSQSVFYLPKCGRIIWTLVIVAIAFCTMPVFISCAAVEWQFLAFLSCAGLAFVGAAPLVHDESDISYKVHMTGAWTCAVCSQLLILVTNPIILLGWIPFTIYYLATMLLNRQENKVFWAEISCFIMNFILCII